MTFSRFLKSTVRAPFMAFACAIFGVLISVLLLLADFLIHLIGGFELGQISQVVDAVARHLPLMFGGLGFLATFMTDTPIASVFGSARWANKKELQKLSMVDEGLLIGRDPITDCFAIMGRRIC